MSPLIDTGVHYSTVPYSERISPDLWTVDLLNGVKYKDDDLLRNFEEIT